MLRRRLPAHDSNTDDAGVADTKITSNTSNKSVDQNESVGYSNSARTQVKSDPSKRPQRKSTNSGRRDSSGKSNAGKSSTGRPSQSRGRPNQRTGRPQGDRRPAPVPAPVEVDKEGDYTDTGSALPGDVIGIVEEFKAGKNTFKHGGNVIATTTGTIRENHKNRVISVVPATSTPPTLNVGDILIGKVFRVKDSVILLDIDTKKGAEGRQVLTTDFGEIHVSNISSRYIKDTRREYAQFDIVKAKVIDPTSMRLSTADDDCGVLKALCSKCLTALDLVDKKLECSSCGNVESRKISSDYGTGTI